MSELWIAVLAAATLIAGVLGRVLVVRIRARSSPAVIADLGDSTSLDWDTGAARSVQRAELLLDERALDEIWAPENLERLARTYWRFISRVTLGVIRVHYSATQRSVVALVPQLKLLTFQAPEYEMDAMHGLVRWRIARGLLVSRKGRAGGGHLQIEVTRAPAEEQGRVRLQVAVEVANFYPSIASRVSRRFYKATQSRIHVIVTYGFLRSLARLDLAPSKVGRFGPQA